MVALSLKATRPFFVLGWVARIQGLAFHSFGLFLVYFKESLRYTDPITRS